MSDLLDMWRSILVAEIDDRRYWLDEAMTAEAQDDPDEAAFCLDKALDADKAVQNAEAVLDSMREERTQADFRLACAQ